MEDDGLTRNNVLIWGDNLAFRMVSYTDYRPTHLKAMLFE
jgi:hypothetical protein